jgi:hypothetical protein
LDLNAPKQAFASGIEAELSTAQFENIGARQTRLTEAMFEIFFRQIKLINAVTIELPLGWLRGEAAPAKASHESVAAPQSASALLSPPPPTPFPPMANLDPPAAAVPPMPQREASQFAKAKAGRKNKTGPKHIIS